MIGDYWYSIYMQKGPTYGSSVHYFDESGENYLSWQNQFGAISGKLTAKKFVPFINSDQVVCDFGAGAGNLLDSINAFRKIAVEINPSAVAILKSKPDIEHYESIENLPTESIDVVITNHAMEHVPYPIGAMKEIYRALKPGGVFVICVPIDDWRSQKKYCESEINHHLQTWTPLLLGHSLKEAGFTVREKQIRIISEAWFPSWHKFVRFPFFPLFCRIYSILLRRRQIIANVYK